MFKVNTHISREKVERKGVGSWLRASVKSLTVEVGQRPESTIYQRITQVSKCEFVCFIENNPVSIYPARE